MKKFFGILTTTLLGLFLIAVLTAIEAHQYHDTLAARLAYLIMGIASTGFLWAGKELLVIK